MTGNREARCGTPGGYVRHKRAGEAICWPCREAYNAYHRQYAHRRARMRATRSEAADPAACQGHPQRTVRGPRPKPFDDIYVDELASVPVPASVPDAGHRVALLVCAHSGLGLDLADPQQLAAAAYRARPVLEALGLTGQTAWRPSPGERKLFGSRIVHGTRSAVDAHQQAGIPLCGPCQRWADVQARKEQP